MPKHKKVLPEIIHSLDKFIDKLLIQIQDLSTDGTTALCAALITAKQLYKKPVDSAVTGWFYQYSRLRGPDIEHAINQIKTCPDVTTRLLVVKHLIENGSWIRDSSFNYYFFIELIKSVPGYKPLDDDLTYHLTIIIKDEIISRIDDFFQQNTVSEKLIREREEEYKSIPHNKRNNVEDVVLVFNNYLVAQNSSKENPDKPHYHLQMVNGLWKLTWLDFQGKSYPLQLTDELTSLLDDFKTRGENSKSCEKMKKECVLARTQFLDKIQLLINPKNPVNHLALPNDALIAEGLVSTFILRDAPNNYSLYWLTSLGTKKEIILADYPEFKNWLNCKALLKEEDLAQLKAFLSTVDIKSSINLVKGVNDFKMELQNLLIPNLLINPRHKEEMPVGRLNPERYAKVTQFFNDRVVVDGSSKDEIFTQKTFEK